MIVTAIPISTSWGAILTICNTANARVIVCATVKGKTINALDFAGADGNGGIPFLWLFIHQTKPDADTDVGCEKGRGEQ